MLAEYQVRLPAVTAETASPEAKSVLDRAQAQVGFIPNMYACMANQPDLLDTYLHGYAAFRSRSAFTVAEQEVVLLAISRANGCEYCVAAHSFMADNKSGVPIAVTDAIRAGRIVPDPRLKALAEFAAAMTAQRGLPSKADAAAFVAAGYTERQVLDILLAIGVKTISNYVNHLFHTPLDAMFEPRRWTD